MRHDGRTCIEFYSRVDWSPIKTVCGDTPLGASGHAQADLAEVRTGFLVAERIREL